MGRRVCVLFLGGTISAGETTGGRTRRLRGDELIGDALRAELAEGGVELDVRDLRAVSSGSLRFGHMLEVLDAARSSDADGIVVVQGTDTLEETSYLLDLLWDDDRPIVFTGAMRGPTLAGPDGPANLLAAARTAASTTWRGLGALLVLADEIHAARFVTKRHSTSISTFVSPNAGPLGRLAEGVPVRMTSVARHAALPAPSSIDVRVPLVVAALDDDGTLLRGVADCDGLVMSGFGVGHVPERIVPALDDLAQRMPVVLASRTGAGQVLHHTYYGAGSETDLLGRGLIPAGMLDAYKSRLLLCVLLAGGAGRDRVVEEFRARG